MCQVLCYFVDHKYEKMECLFLSTEITVRGSIPGKFKVLELRKQVVALQIKRKEGLS